jgi:hypothetical protein
MGTEDLVTGYMLAAQLRELDLDRHIDMSLRLWMFRAQEALGARGALERVREYLPYWIDPATWEPLSPPRPALPPGAGPGRPVKAIPGHAEAQGTARQEKEASTREA